MTARVFDIADATQTLPTGSPSYITRALFAFGSNSASLASLVEGRGASGQMGWGVYDESQGAAGGIAANEAGLGFTDTGGAASRDVGTEFYGHLDGDVSSLFQGRLSVNSFDCAEADIAAASGSSRLLALLSIGGKTLSSYVGSFQLRNTNGSQAITGVGFQPDLVLLGGVSHDFWGNPGANVNPWGLSFGAATATDEFATAVGGEYLQSSADRLCRTSGSACLLDMRPGHGMVSTATMTSLDSDGFTLSVTSSINHYYWFLCLADPDGEFAIGTGVQGDTTISPGFDPEAVIFAGAGNTIIDWNQAGAVFNMGCADSRLEQFAGFGGGAGFPRSAYYWNAKAMTISTQIASDPVVNAEAEVTSMGSTTSLNWTSDDSSGCYFGWVAISTSTGPGYLGCGGFLGQIIRRL